MSSSDASHNARGFLAAFTGTLVLLGAMLATILLVVDPLGAGGGNAFCPAGAKTWQPSFSKFIVPHRQGANSAILGTSRVHYAFDTSLLQAIGGPGMVNLGVAGGLTSDFDVLAEEMLATSTSPDIFIGADFNLAHQAEGGIPPSRWERASGNTVSRLRAYYFNFSAMRVLPEAILDCTVMINTDGSPVRNDADAPLGVTLLRENFSILFDRMRAADTDSLMEQRLAELQLQIRSWKSRGANVALFVAPYGDEFRAMVDEVGKTDAFEDYHRRLAGIAAQEDVPYLDFHGPAQFAALNLPPCPDDEIQCHFYDLTHYDSSVAQAMAPHLRQVMDQAKR